MKNADNYTKLMLLMGDPESECGHYLGELILATAQVCKTLCEKTSPEKVDKLINAHSDYFNACLNILFLPIKEGKNNAGTSAIE